MSHADPPLHAPGTRGWIRTLVEEMTGTGVLRVAAPGGRGRHAVRATLEDGRSVILSRRETPARTENEAGLLQVLHAEGAPVPAVIGYRDGLLIQQDLGPRRLSHAMAEADAPGRERLARAAVGALAACRAAMDRRPDIRDRLPGLGTAPRWIEDFVSRPFFLSGDLGIAVPSVDADALAQALAHPPRHFTRWNAALSNAAVQPDGTVSWFDWDLFGRRGGVEDVGWMVADECWGLDAAATQMLLADLLPDPAGRTLARRMAVLIGAAGLGRIDAGSAQAGDPVAALSARLAALSLDDPLVAGFAPWFDAAAEALRMRRAAAA